MREEQERRAVARIPLADRPAARVPGVQGVRLLNRSLGGAQIEHLGPLRPGVTCVLDLPPPRGVLNLPAQVVWCTVIGRTHKHKGESHLVARSGRRFSLLTVNQQAALADTLHAFATALQPIA